MARPEPFQVWSERLGIDGDRCDSLRRASRFLPENDPWARVFFEERQDVIVRLGSDEPPAILTTGIRGLRVRRGGAEPRAVFLADPHPDDASVLIRRMDEAFPVVPRGAPSDGPRLNGGARELLEALLREAGARSGGDVFSARYVASRQRVYVAGRNIDLRSDLRAGSRLRVEVCVRSGGRERSRAVCDRALGHADPVPVVGLLVEEAGRRARERLEARPMPPGEATAVFAPGVAGVLIHELVGHALEADTALRGASGRFVSGARVAGPDVTVLDDPRRGRVAWRIDDEGCESGATSLLERGRVAGCLHDLRSAALSGRRPTGHGRCSSFREPVRPRMGCTYLAPGRLAAGEVVEDTRSGVYVRRMEAASTETTSGVATFRVTDADRIEGGRAVHALESFLLRLDAASALVTLDRIAEDLSFDTSIGSCVRDGQTLAMSVGAPTCRTGLTRVVS